MGRYYKISCTPDSTGGYRVCVPYVNYYPPYLRAVSCGPYNSCGPNSGCNPFRNNPKYNNIIWNNAKCCQ